MHSAFATAGPLGSASGSLEYRPGVCNIGPAEVARRRRAGHTGLIATFALFAVLVAVGAPPLARLSLAIPAVIAASGYLQAWLKFCAGFGAKGVFNFGPLGPTEAVVDEEARARDRRRARQIGLASLAVGMLVAIVAVLWPI
jgi:hypothetical protein